METHARVQQAALELFAAKGFHATSIRDIANAAGITTASMYHYVDSKDELLHTIMRRGLMRLIAASDLLLSSVTSSSSARLAALVQLHVWVHGVRQLSARVTDTETRSLTGEARNEIVGLRDQYQRRWLDVISDGVESAEFHAANVRMTTIAILEMCTGVSHWYSQSGELTLGEIAEQYANISLAMVFSSDASNDGSLKSKLRIDPVLYYQQEPAHPGLSPI